MLFPFTYTLKQYKLNLDEISAYFNAEKAESLLFISVGIVAIVTASYFLLKVKQPFYCGISYPLIIIGLIQLTVGASVYFRSPKDIQRVNQIIQTDKSKIQTEEIPRMKIVMKNFSLYKKIETGLMIVGLLMFLFLSGGSSLKGVGTGLLIQALFMLILDLFAESRGKEYLNFLLQI